MARQRDLLLNIDRMRREMDELFADPWEGSRRRERQPRGFTPRVDVYYCRASGESDEGGAEVEGEPKAVVKADLAGVDPDGVSLEISGRRLVLTGERPIRDTEGRAYQQVEIATGPFRRVIELGAEVHAEKARATFEDGILRIEIPLRVRDAATRKVPVERAE